MAASERGLVRRWFEEVWNERRAEAMAELAAPDIVFHGTGGPGHVMRGIEEGFRPFYDAMLGAFPDIRFTIEASVREGDIEALRWSARMTHRGEHLGVAATHKPLVLTGMVFARIADGKVVESWDNWDMMGLLNQIGALDRAHILSPR